MIMMVLSLDEARAVVEALEFGTEKIDSLLEGMHEQSLGREGMEQRLHISIAFLQRLRQYRHEALEKIKSEARKNA